jgi:ribosomal protein S18 acetylase RimI-like enzyme
MEIRSADRDDWFRLKRARVRALTDAPDAFAATIDEERSRPDEEWKARATPGPDSTTFLAIQHDEVRGMVGVQRDEQGAELATLVGMWVDPIHRGGGIGRALIDAVVPWCIEREVSELRLWVTRSNTGAIRLYRSYGFVTTGNEQRLPSNRILSEVEMSLSRERFLAR